MNENAYSITTAHNVRLTLPLASFGDRLVGFILDSIIKFGYLLAVFFIGAVVVGSPSGWDISGWIIAVVAVILPYMFYSLFFEYFMGGQTPGKRVMKIKVVSAEGETLTFGQCILRWIFRIVDFGFYGVVAIVMILASQRKQRLGDLLAGTIVVMTRPEKTLDETVYIDVEPGRQPSYMQAGRLTAREVEIVKEVIRMYDQEHRDELLPVTADRIRATLGIDDEPDDLILLRTIIEDYYILAVG